MFSSALSTPLLPRRARARVVSKAAPLSVKVSRDPSAIPTNRSPTLCARETTRRREIEGRVGLGHRVLVIPDRDLHVEREREASGWIAG